MRLKLTVAALAVAIAALTIPATSEAGLPASCNAVAVPSLLRAESLTDAVGDIVVQCSGGTPTPISGNVPTTSVEVDLPTTTVTSRVLRTAGGWGEPLMLIDEPAPGAQFACATPTGDCTITGTGNGAGVYTGSPGRPNVFQGTVSSNAMGTGPGNSITFANIPLDAPGGGTRRLRIVNLRVDASQIVPPATQVNALVLVGGAPAGLGATVGIVQQGLIFGARTPTSPTTPTAPLTAPTQLSSCAGTQGALTLRYTEGFPVAFRPRTANSSDPAAPVNQNVIGQANGSESGFFNSSLVGDFVQRGDLRIAGLADSGTRVKAVFAGVPDGTQVYAPTVYTDPTGSRQLTLVHNETGPFAPVLPTGTGPAGTAPLPVSGGTATAVYEVVAADRTAVDTFDVPISVGPGDTAGTATVSGGFAPAGGTSGIPRFAASSESAPVGAFTVVPCPQPPPPVVVPTTAPTTTVTNTVTTQTPGPTTTVTGPPAPTPPAASVGRLGRTTVKVDRHGRASIPVRCDGQSDCTFALRLQGGKAARTRAVTLGSGSGRVAAGASGTVAVRLTRNAQSTLRRTRRLAATLTGTVTSAGTPAPISGRLSLRR